MTSSKPNIFPTPIPCLLTPLGALSPGMTLLKSIMNSALKSSLWFMMVSQFVSDLIVGTVMVRFVCLFPCCFPFALIWRSPFRSSP